MGIFTDVAGRLARDFVSLDDLVFGKSLISEGMSQLRLTGRGFAGTVAVTSNAALRGAMAGVQVGAKAAGVTASMCEGIIPGASLAKSLAEHLDREASKAGEGASQRASHAVELASGKAPRNPLSGEEWPGVPAGYGWPDLAADTAVTPFHHWLRLPLTLSLSTLAETTTTPEGRRAVEGALDTGRLVLDMIPGSDDGDHPSRLDTVEVSEALLSLAAQSGLANARRLLELSEALTRCSLGDTRELAATIHDVISEMERLTQHDEESDPFIGSFFSAQLRERACNIVDHPPRRFLAALERGPLGEPPELGLLLKAMLDDFAALRRLLTDAPAILTAVAARITLRAGAAMTDVDEIESFLEAGTSTRPWSLLEMEAGTSTTSPTATKLGRETAFVCSTEVLGREAALERAERIFSRRVRDDLEHDISLAPELAAVSPQTRLGLLHQRVVDASAEELVQQRDHCAEQLAHLETFRDAMHGFLPSALEERAATLRLYGSLAQQQIAMPAVTEGTLRDDAWQAFAAWTEA